MNLWPLALMAALLIAASAVAADDAKLAAFYDSFLDAQFRRHPLEATRAGDHRFDALLDDLSPAARQADETALRDALAALPKVVSKANLTRPAQIDYEILEHHLRRALWLIRNADPLTDDPRSYTEYASDSVYLLLTQSTLSKEENLRNAAARIERVPAVVAAARANLKHPPRILTEAAIQQTRGAINFYETGIFQLTGEPAALSPLAGPSRRAADALKQHLAFLETDLLSRSTGDWRLGPAKFGEKLALELNAGVTAALVKAEAEAEATRVEAAMAVVARQLWAGLFPGVAVPPDDPAGRQTLVRQVLAKLAQDHGTAESLVGDARQTVAGIKRFIEKRRFLTLPDPDQCQVVEMPEFQRGYSVAYLNPAPPLDPKANHVYAVSPPARDWDSRRTATYFEEYNRAMLQILTIHEAYPGHYVQLAYSNRHPSKLRRVLADGTFSEGWAVYTEQAMLDEGYGDGDLSLRLHQLKWYLRAVCNALLDHAMHCDGMTDAAAMELLVSRAFQSEAEAVGKVKRAKQQSCQLSTYFVGRMAFYQLRQAVHRRDGERFDLGRYHEAVLSHGTPPVKYLPELLGLTPPESR